MATLIGAVLASVGLCVWLVIALLPPPIDGWARELNEFARSPGAAASTALVAAVVAFAGISRQVAVSRDLLEHQKDAKRDEAWWAMFVWASDRAIPQRQSDQALPTSVMISTLQRLADSASAPVQQAACAGVIDVLTQAVEQAGTTAPSSLRGTFGFEGDDSDFSALASYVQASRGTAAASARAEALVYAGNVHKALTAISWGSPDVRVFRNPGRDADSGVDAVAEVGARRVLIQIKAVDASGRSRATPQLAVEAIRALTAHDEPILWISPLKRPLSSEEEIRLRAVASQWRGPGDSENLLADLRRAATLS